MFVVSRVSENAILGMPFLHTDNCSLDFAQPVSSVTGKELTCTDRHEKMLVSTVQVTCEVVIPAIMETALVS